MIELNISEKDPRQIAIKEQLERLVLARKVEIDNELVEPVIKHDGEVYKGFIAIALHLQTLEYWVSQWNRCLCD